MDYNYMQVEAAKKLLCKEPDGSNANMHARQKARMLLRSVSEDFVQFAMLNPRSRPGQYLLNYADDLLEICEQNGYIVPTKKDQFLDANELDLLDKETISQMLNDEDTRFTRLELAQALHRKLNIEDALS